MIESAPAVSAPTLSVIICSQPRSGSTLLCDLLGLAGEMPRPEEWLLPTFEVPLASRFGLPPEHERIDYIRELVARKSSAEGVFSVKLMGWNFGEMIPALRTRYPEYAHRSPAEILNDLFPHPHYLYLRRRDHLAQGVSYARAVQTQIWKSSQNRSGHSQPLVYSHLQIQHLMQGVKISEAGWAHFFATSGIEPFELVYEDFIADPIGNVRKVHAWLGLPPPENENALEARSQRGRQSDGLNRQWVERFQAENEAAQAVPKVARFDPGSFTLALDRGTLAMNTVAPQILPATVTNTASTAWLGSGAELASDHNWVVLQGEIEGIHGLTPGRPYIFQEVPFPLGASESVSAEIFLTPIKQPGRYPLRLSLMQKRDDGWHRLSNEVAFELEVHYPTYRQQSLALFPDLEMLGDIGCHAPGFGHFFDPQFPWICHDDYGWIFLDTEKSTSDALWFNDEALGWMRMARTEPGVFFLDDSQRTLRFIRRTGDERIFADPTTGQEETHPVRETAD